MIRFVDLFAGIGGIRLGFEKAVNEMGLNSKCILSSEIDKYAKETYNLNFNEVPNGDIYKISDFPDFDFLLAGFPCQPFSYAGKHKGFVDTRGTLFFEIERILKKKNPKYFLLENVRGLVSHDNGRTLKTILHKLNALGYGTEVRILNSSEFGVPQNRIRLYILGLKNDQPKLTIETRMGANDSHDFKRRKNNSKSLLVKDILETNVHHKYDCSKKFKNKILHITKCKNIPLNGVRLIDFRNGNSIHSWEMGIKGNCSSKEIELMNALVANRRKKIFGSYQDGKSLNLDQISTFFDHKGLKDILNGLVKKGYLKIKNNKYDLVSGNMSFEIFKVLDPESIAITLVSSDAHKLGIFYENRLRRLTPRECARLQGFQDDFICHPNDSYAYRQFGNSVSIPVVEALIKDFLSLNLSSENTHKISSHKPVNACLV